ncbi:MAG: DNA cytosine methyltransferase, partial [Candidatus Fimenecus sp.]
NPSQSGKSRCLTAGYANKGVQHILESNFSDDPHKQTWDCVAEQTRGDVTQEKQTGKRIYTVENGQITIKGIQYPIALADGEYIIRKLTPIECERLQTLPDGYTAAVSNAQRYKGLGNGWTADVIVHILWGALRNIPRNEEILVLSMYDGIGTGRYCLEKMGFTNVKYFAYEIDKYAMTVANSNFSDIIQCGDAFDLRRNNWKIGG